MIIYIQFTESTMNEITRVFKEIDKDESKYLTIEECFQYWKKFPMVNTSMMISELDLNNDGIITFDEWLHFWEYLADKDKYSEEMILSEVY